MRFFPTSLVLAICLTFASSHSAPAASIPVKSEHACTSAYGDGWAELRKKYELADFDDDIAKFGIAFLLSTSSPMGPFFGATLEGSGYDWPAWVFYFLSLAPTVAAGEASTSTGQGALTYSFSKEEIKDQRDEIMAMYFMLESIGREDFGRTTFVIGLLDRINAARVATGRTEMNLADLEAALSNFGSRMCEPGKLWRSERIVMELASGESGVLQ